MHTKAQSKDTMFFSHIVSTKAATNNLIGYFDFTGVRLLRQKCATTTQRHGNNNNNTHTNGIP